MSETSKSLLYWYDKHARQLPWRVSPKSRSQGVMPDPYKVWLSEIMLQQTTVATVKGYFERFISRWPDISALSAASEDDVLKAWAGLGYYSRARNLKKCADTIMHTHGGAFPSDVERLRALPGIGEYTSAAIASIAFNTPSAVVDGNVERVFSRLFALDTPLPAAKKLIKVKVSECLDEERPGDFAQATMDLGATICSPKNPACGLCPLNTFCLAYRDHQPEQFPIRVSKKAKPKRQGAAFVALSPEGNILLEKRQPTGLLASMSQVPTTNWNSRQDGAIGVDAAPFPANWRHCGLVSHVFTHFELQLTIWRADDVKHRQNDQWWVALPNAFNEALPTVMKKAIACAIPETFRDTR